VVGFTCVHQFNCVEPTTFKPYPDRSPNDTLLWIRSIPSTIPFNTFFPSLSISANASYIIVGDETASFYVFNRTGTPLWSYQFPSPFASVADVAVSPNGMYVAALAIGAPGNPVGELAFFSASGHLLWTYSNNNPYWGTHMASFNKNGSLLAVSIGNGFADAGWVYLFNPTGDIVWVRSLPSTDPYNVYLSPNGEHVVVQTSALFNVNGGFTALLNGSTGAILWNYTTGTDGSDQSTFSEDMAVSPNWNTIAAANYGEGSSYNGVYLFNTAGLIAKYPLAGQVVGILDNGTLLVGVGSTLYLLEPLGSVYSSVNLPSNATYVSTSVSDGYAVGTGSGVLLYPGKTSSVSVTTTFGNISIIPYSVDHVLATSLPGYVVVELYNSTYHVSELLSGSDSGALFTHLEAGEYYVSVYHYPDTSLNITEYWGTANVDVVGGVTTYYDFMRSTPYISGVSAGSRLVPPGTSVVLNLNITNPESLSLQTVVGVWVYSRVSNSLEPNVTSGENNISAGSSSTFSFSATPPLAGVYYLYAVVYSNIGGQEVATDQYNWTEIFTAPYIFSIPVLFTDTKHTEVFEVNPTTYTEIMSNLKQQFSLATPPNLTQEALFLWGDFYYGGGSGIYNISVYQGTQSVTLGETVDLVYSTVLWGVRLHS
jgi:hypothetical protein